MSMEGKYYMYVELVFSLFFFFLSSTCNRVEWTELVSGGNAASFGQSLAPPASNPRRRERNKRERSMAAGSEQQV